MDHEVTKKIEVTHGGDWGVVICQSPDGPEWVEISLNNGKEVIGSQAFPPDMALDIAQAIIEMAQHCKSLEGN